MVGWIILGVIAALIVVLLCLRVSAQISFGEELRVTAQIGPVKMQIIPPPEKKTAGEKPKKAAAKAEKKPKEKKKPDIHLTLEDIRGALHAVWQAIQGALRRAGKRIRIDPLRLSFVFGDEDPVNTAQWYGWANSAMWAVMPRLEEMIHVPDPRIHMEMDFTAAETKISGTVGASYRIGDLLAIGFAAIGPVLRFGIPFLRKQKAFKKAEAARLAAEQAEQKKDGAAEKAA